ncbi:IS3 family transposase (plasmid) [Priestia megaterium]|uniref:IS3 family transposase n=4 Tax=Priestia megaterium TaxID=1404 RepID=UPI000E1FE921|nr:IS3 family transposase [Priestia megaterium]MDR4231616.1 IS3 family transposase [Priestia megaterium]MED3810225.1 IS3 family transposase [Priestia megaterium]MED4399140.1 IS3 family transposase [Priestia megaterium]MED4736172.1 IS3 family transposase [Priestia megaterium]QCY28474.1 IS3 family transposase [Priestia megaterium NBRC 15308 = ATCC 14581]
MGRRVSYPVEVKLKAIEMRLAGVPIKEVMETLQIRNYTQLKTWMRWHRDGESYRLAQPVGQTYTPRKGAHSQDTPSKLEAENRYLKQQIEGLKKVQRVGKGVVPEVVLNLVEELKEKLPISQICQCLGIPRSTYYRWQKNEQGEETKRKKWIEGKVGEQCRKHKFRYGYRKITALLNQTMHINHKTVQRVMQKYGWQCRVKRKKRKQTGQPYQVAENVLNRNFRAERPLQKLVTDITYLPFGPKQLYLSSIQDLFNGEIIAYSVRDCQNVEFVLDTLSQLPSLPQGCTLHSDQGSVYTSYAYQRKVKERGIIMSMSRKGTPADNASIESFHSSLKSETFYLDELTCTTTAIVEQTVESYITYYNHIRIQTKLNNQSPVQYRQLAV